MIGDGGEMGVASSREATDYGGQGDEVTLSMTGGVRVKELHEA